MARFSNKEMVCTVKETLETLERGAGGKKHPDDGLFVDVGNNGKGYFPKLTPLGRGTCGAWEVDYNSLTRSSGFDIPNVNVIYVDRSESEEFERGFVGDFEGQDIQPNIPPYAMTIANLKKELASLDPNTVILKPSNMYKHQKGGPFFISAHLSVYNNNTYPFIGKDGNPITMGLKGEDPMVGFSFIGKNGRLVEGIHWTFIPKNKAEEDFLKEQKANFKRFLK